MEIGTDEGWTLTQKTIGTLLPSDYKRFVRTFGTGYISDFIWVFNPFSKKDSMNLLKQINIRLDALREIQKVLPEDVLFKFFPEHGGLLPIGATGNGDCLYWLTQGDSDSWPVIVNESRGPDWRRFDLSLTDFLAEILQKKIICDVFPSDFPSKQADFVPHV